MTQWGNTDVVTNSVSWAASSIQAGSGPTAIAANNVALYQNTTPDAFIDGLTIGQFGASKVEMGIAGEGAYVHAPGWQLRRVGEGSLESLTVVNGSRFVNGEYINVTGGAHDAVFAVVTNATGNAVGATVVDGGLFQNTGVLSYSFGREQHLNAVASFTVANTGTGYANTDYIVCSNGITDGLLTVVTDAAGNIASTNATSVGLWANDAAATDVVVTIYAANGGSSNGTGADLTANLVTSTGGTISAGVLGGRAGRITYETLAVVKEITSGTADDTYLPNA